MTNTDTPQLTPFDVYVEARLTLSADLEAPLVLLFTETNGEEFELVGNAPDLKAKLPSFSYKQSNLLDKEVLA